MVKVFALIPRRPDVTEQFFHQHWAGPHAQLALRITTLQRYVQSHRIAAGVTGLPDSIYEGVAEVWFTDAATAAGMGEDPNYADHAHVDEPTFIDTDRLGFVITEEDVVRAGPPIAKGEPGTKVMLLLRRAPGRAPAEFARRLADLGPSIAELLPEARRVTVATTIADMYADGAEPTFDAIVELSFPDAAAFERAWAASGGAILDELDGDIDRDRSAAFLAQELRVKWPQKVAAAG